MSADPEPEATSAADLRDAALRYLAQREHSRQQLAQKLRRKFGAALPGSAVDQVLADLAEDGLQSDQRFVEAKCRQRLRSGYGPLKLRADLAAAGIDSGLASTALDSLDMDWNATAKAAAEARFPAAGSDPREQQRCARFLRSRGYPEAAIRSVLLD